MLANNRLVLKMDVDVWGHRRWSVGDQTCCVGSSSKVKEVASYAQGCSFESWLPSSTFLMRGKRFEWMVGEKKLNFEYGLAEKTSSSHSCEDIFWNGNLNASRGDGDDDEVEEVNTASGELLDLRDCLELAFDWREFLAEMTSSNGSWTRMQSWSSCSFCWSRHWDRSGSSIFRTFSSTPPDTLTSSWLAEASSSQSPQSPP